MAFVPVQHLSPDHKSMLAELVGNATKMNVIEARDGQPLKSDCLFVVPPDATMTIRDGKLTIVNPRRLQVLHVETPEAHVDRLAEHPEELDMLLREV